MTPLHAIISEFTQAEIKPDSRLRQDLGLETVLIESIAADLESHYGIDISHRVSLGWKTVSDVEASVDMLILVQPL